MDRISCLPNSILCEILSYLPTNVAVSTSILSRRWRHVWKDLQVLDIDYTLLWSCREPKFDSYVNAILAQRNAGSYPIQKFRLTCYLASEDSISTWLDAVIGPHLQELYLSIGFMFRTKLPESILTCPSLKSLVLKRYCPLDYSPESSKVYLPSLKTLELGTICADPSKLLSGCPVLENLNIILDITDIAPSHYVYIPRIQMPRTLKSLTFVDHIGIGNLLNEICHRVIDIPSLEYLNITTTNKVKFSFSNFPNMVEAHLDIHHDYVEHESWVPELLLALSKTKLLALKYRITRCLFSGLAFEFPEYPRLLNLELDVPFFTTNFLLNFLHNCHVLEVLVIHDLKRVSLYPNGPAPPTMVPKCVTSHLKSFTYRGYRDSTDEREFIAYLLQRGLVLKTVIIHLNFDFDQETKYNIIRKLSTIPKDSTTCQAKFY